MLVLRRQAGESFKIGDDVEVRILRVGRTYVKVGVIAPPELGIVRSELSRLNQRAAVKNLSDPRVETSLKQLAQSLRPQPDSGSAVDE